MKTGGAGRMTSLAHGERIFKLEPVFFFISSLQIPTEVIFAEKPMEISSSHRAMRFKGELASSLSIIMEERQNHTPMQWPVHWNWLSVVSDLQKSQMRDNGAISHKIDARWHMDGNKYRLTTCQDIRCTVETRSPLPSHAQPWTADHDMLYLPHKKIYILMKHNMDVNMTMRMQEILTTHQLHHSPQKMPQHHHQTNLKKKLEFTSTDWKNQMLIATFDGIPIEEFYLTLCGAYVCLEMTSLACILFTPFQLEYIPVLVAR